MPTANSPSSGNSWLFFALLTVASWGVYGVFLHKGQLLMVPAGGKINATILYKSFLFVGIAYFLTAVLLPLVLLLTKGEAFVGYSSSGSWWSLIAGAVGAVGAFGVLLAFGAKGSPPVVMAIVFAGAPIVNAVVSLAQHPPAGGWGSIKPQFYVGILCAAVGGMLVTKYNPAQRSPAKHAQATAPAVASASSASANAPK